jgi:hypothetical protein
MLGAVDLTTPTCVGKFFSGCLWPAGFVNSQRFSGLVAALKLAKHGDVLMAMLLTASSGK